LISSVLSCSSFSTTSPPNLNQRTLELSLSKPGHLQYGYDVCKGFACLKKEHVIEYWNLNDPETVKKLVETGFVVVVEGSKPN
jgi:hypothetical protein